MSEEIIDAEFEEVLPAEIEGRTDEYYLNGKLRLDYDYPDGVYCNMPDELYFAQDRLGSTDLKLLSGDDAENWWYGSRYNEFVEEVDSPDDLVFGKALHCALLEGMDVFEARYAEIPAEYEDAKTGEKKKWNGNANVCKDWLKAQKAAGLETLSAKNYRNVYQMGFVLQRHPVYKEWLSGGLAEVAVLFTYGGLRMRAKFDKLLPYEIVDLKSAGRHKMAMFVPPGISRDVWTAMRIIRDLGYALQRHLYSKARVFLNDFVINGQVHGATEADMEFLKTLPAIKAWNFVFLFFRKISNSKKNPAAPVITPIVREPGDMLDDKGEKDLNSAFENYKRLMETFGKDVPWARFNLPSMPEDTAFLDLFGRDPETPADPAVNEDGEWDAEENDDAA